MANTGSTTINAAPSTTPSNWNLNANVSFNSLVGTPDNGSQVVNVVAFGAVGDGVNDDTLSIQAAITATSAKGGTVYLPAGTYKVTSALTPLSKVRIQGAGSGVTTVAGSGSQFSIFQNLATVGSPLTDVEICDMTIDGTNVGFTSLSPAIKGIYIQYVKRLKLHGLYVYNTWATGIGTDFLVDSQIDRCVVDNCGVRGVAAGMGTGCNGIGIGTGAYAIEDWVVSNCVATTCGNNGLMLEDQFQTIRSAGNTFSNCLSIGCKFGYRNSGSNSCSFENCWAINTVREGFTVTTGDVGTLATAFNPQKVTLSSCYSISSGSGGSFDGFLVTDAKATPDGTLSEIVFDNCRSIGSGEHGFQVKNATNIALNNCQANNNNNHGILAFSSNSAAPFNNLTINGGKFYNNNLPGTNSSDGVRMGSSGSGTMDGAKVSNIQSFDNQSVKTQRYGVSVTGTITNSDISSNNIRNNNTSAFNIATPSTSLILRNNVGYNPIGQASISVTASPFTYTAGNSPEDVFITGGTVSLIVKGATTLAAATNFPVHLEPNQSVVVTYSAAPTMVTDKY